MLPVLRFALTLIALVAALQSPCAHADEAVDLLLVLAADVSRSIDQPKFMLQRQGYAAALSDPRVLAAIQGGTRGRIALCLIEWSGSSAQKLVIDWTAIGDAGTAQQFGDKILKAPRSFADRTSISGGIDFALKQFDRAPYEGGRRVIDVSGDGTNNSGRDVVNARDDAVAAGITINGLVILSERAMPWNPEHTHPPGGLEKYYRDNVIGGPGAFAMTAENFNSFGQTIITKLIAEIAQAPFSRHAALPRRERGQASIRWRAWY
jgi:hypothetical protein